MELKDIDKTGLENQTNLLSTEPWLGQEAKKTSAMIHMGQQSLNSLHGFLTSHLQEIYKKAGFHGETGEIFGAKASNALLSDFGSYDHLRKYMLRNTTFNPNIINRDFHEATMHHVRFNMWMQENSDLVQQHLNSGKHITELIQSFQTPAQNAQSSGSKNYLSGIDNTFGKGEFTGDVDENGNLI